MQMIFCYRIIQRITRDFILLNTMNRNGSGRTRTNFRGNTNSKIVQTLKENRQYSIMSEFILSVKQFLNKTSNSIEREKTKVMKD